MKLSYGLGLMSLVGLGFLSCTDSPTALPETCQDAQEAAVEETGDRPANGTYTLYIDADETKAWEVYCHNMNRAEPSEYLTVDEAENYSEVSTSLFGAAKTNFRRYRIDPIKLEIDLLDDTFASTDGDESLVPDMRDHIPAGWAQFGTDMYNSDDTAEAKIDLAGTEFAFATSTDTNDFFCTVEEGGINLSEINVASDLTSVVLTAANSSMTELTKTVADCDQLSGEDNPGTDEEFENAKLPLQFIVN